jgi:uncharacterized protein YgfB (UPF0149 family)
MRKMPQQAPPFDELQRVLTQSHALTDAAEAHGTLVGSLCATPCSLEDWLAEILPDGRTDAQCAASLRAIFDFTCGALGDGTLAFQPLLPGDDATIDDRTCALGEWCQGFLYGLSASAAVPEAASLNGEAAEVLRDMTEITHVDVDPEDDAETNEAAYAELVEFVRVGVQLLYEHLQPLREPAERPREVLH